MYNLSHLMHHPAVEIQHVVPEGLGGGGHHEVALHHVEPHALGVLHPLDHQAPPHVHRDGGAGEPHHLAWVNILYSAKVMDYK